MFYLLYYSAPTIKGGGILKDSSPFSKFKKLYENAKDSQQESEK